MVSTDDLSENPDWMSGIAERKIQDAIDEGLFDNLPGAGRPIDLSVSPYEVPGMGAINRLLKHNKVVPGWVLLEREIAASRDQAQMILERWETEEVAVRGTSQYVLARDAARTAYEQAMTRTNQMILKYNVSNPFVHRTSVPFLIKRRLQEFDARYGSLEPR